MLCDRIGPVWLSGVAGDLAAMFRYYREHDIYNDLRKPEDAIFRGPNLRDWASANCDALREALNR